MKHRSAVARDLRTPKYRSRVVPSKKWKSQRLARHQVYDTVEEYHDYYDKLDAWIEENQDEYA